MTSPAPMPLGLRASRSIRHAEVGGCRVILDLRTAQYQVLDAVASRMWTALTAAADLEAVVGELALQYGVAQSRVESDLEALAKRCVRDQFLELPDCPLVSVYDEGPAARSLRGQPYVPTRAAALYCMLATARALRKDGFAATYLRYDKLPRGTSTAGASVALDAFARAENWHLPARGSDDCLARSLALFRFLNGSGVTAGHVIGVCRYPFRAHAWVEVDGRPLLQASTSDYTSLARL